jgi:uncharacterized membrane protein YqjE
METSSDKASNLGDASKRIAHRAFVIVENRIQLLMVEAEEERGRILRAMWMAMAVVAFGLLAGVTVTVIVAVAFWNYYPLIALVVLAALYAAGAVLFYVKLLQLQRDWQTLPATIDQIRKDRECLEKQLA